MAIAIAIIVSKKDLQWQTNRYAEFIVWNGAVYEGSILGRFGARTPQARDMLLLPLLHCKIAGNRTRPCSYAQDHSVAQRQDYC